MRFDPHHLTALAAILRLGSFEAAAAELSVTPSAISQRIKTLEDKVGTALVHRGPPCRGTSAGVRIAKHAEDVGLLEAQLSRDLSLDHGPDPARLKIAVTADSLATWFIPAMQRTSDILFELVLDDQDHSAEWLQRGEVSAAISAGGKPVTGCDSFPLGTMRYIATASPAFMRRWFPDGVTSQALARAPCLTFNTKDALQREWLTTHFGPRIVPPSHFLPSSHAFVDAARAGLGWGMNPELLVKTLIRDSHLRPLLRGAPLDVPLNWQVSRIMAPALRPLTQAVRTAAAKGLIPA